MKKLCLLLFSSILSFFATLCWGLDLPADTTDTSVGNVTMLIYHKFEEPQYPTTNVSAQQFEEQLRFLRDNSYDVITLSRFFDLLKGGARLPEKTVVITIDDGYSSTYTVAWPLLQKYEYPCTVFLYAKAIERNYRNFLTWEQIHEMQSMGVDFQDHGYSHYRLGTVPDRMSPQEYHGWITNDLVKGRNILEKGLGYTPSYLALPYGEYNTEVLKVAQELHYKGVVTQDPGSISRFTSPFMVPREPILGKEWSTLHHFTMVLERKDLPLGTIVPNIDRHTNLSPPQFCAELLLPALYPSDRLRLYVSELGWIPGKLSGNRFCAPNKTPLNRRTNRVALRGLEKGTGNGSIHYWLLMNQISIR